MLVLNDFWYIAAPSAELRDTPIRRAVENQVLVLFRDGAGRPHALTDRCAHRGMALSCGRVRDDCVECPYHGWRYDGSGALRVVPALCEGEAPPRPASMRAFPVSEQDGHLWVWIGGQAPDRPPFRFPGCGEPGWAHFAMHTRFAAPVEACLENFLDVPHTAFTHPGLFRGAARCRTRARVTRDVDFAEADFLDEPELEGIGPRLLFPKGTRMRHTDRFLLPSITRVDYAFGEAGHFVITSQCTQREESATDVTTVIAWRLGAPAWLARPFLRWYCRHVIRQDVAMLKVQGEQLRRFGRSYLSTSADLLGRHIASLRRGAAEGRAMPQEAPSEIVLMT